MRFYIISFFILLSLGAFSHTLPDSLLTIDKVYEYTFSDFARSEEIVRVLRKQGKGSKLDLDIAEGDLYFNTGKYYHALSCYERALADKTLQRNDTLYMEQLHRMISCSDALHCTDRQTKYVELLLNKAESCHDEAMQSVAIFNMGKILYNQGLKEEGYERMSEAIELMKRTDYKYKYDNLRYNYNVLLVFQERDKRYEEELHTLSELEKIVSAATGEEMHDMELLDEKELKSVYAHRAIALNRMGKTTEAEKNFKHFQQLTGVYAHDNYLIMPYLFDRGMYDVIIRMNRQREADYREAGDTLSYHMLTIKRSLAKAYAAKGDFHSSSELFRELALLTDHIKKREQESSALELAALYDLNEKNKQIMEQEAEIKNRTIIIGSLIAGLLLLLFTLWRYYVYTNHVREKNKALAVRVNEMAALAESLHKAKAEHMQLIGEDTSPSPQQAASAEKQSKSFNEEERIRENKRLFDRLDGEIYARKLYLKPDISRDELQAVIGVDKNRFADIMQENTAGRLNEYLNGIRITHAIQLMKTKNNYKFQAIALESGFINMTTFNSAFKRYTGLTPSQYRQTMNN